MQCEELSNLQATLTGCVSWDSEWPCVTSSGKSGSVAWTTVDGLVRGPGASQLAAASSLV